MSTDLAIANESLPVATADDFGRGSVAGRGDVAQSISRVVAYQGTPKEEEKYGRHDRGTFLDALDASELGMSIRIMPAFSYATYELWESKDDQKPAKVWGDRKDVPADLLEWADGPNGKRIPPKVREIISAIVVVQSKETGDWLTLPYPFLLQFKSTALPAFDRTIGPVEARRAMQGKCPGLYEVSTVKDTNGSGQPYQRITARPAGDPPADVVELAKVVFRQAAAARKAAEAVAEETGGFDPDSQAR